MQIRSPSIRSNFPKIYSSWCKLKLRARSIGKIRIWVFKSVFQIMQSNAKSKMYFTPTPEKSVPVPLTAINKSKAAFHGFPVLPFYWEMRKKICKTVRVPDNCSCLRTAFQKIISRTLPSFTHTKTENKKEKNKLKKQTNKQKKRKKGNPSTGFYQRWNPFSDFASFTAGFQNLIPDFRWTTPFCVLKFVVSF